jgi:hypothetical protein
VNDDNKYRYWRRRLLEVVPPYKWASPGDIYGTVTYAQIARALGVDPPRWNDNGGPIDPAPWMDALSAQVRGGRIGTR